MFESTKSKATGATLVATTVIVCCLTILFGCMLAREIWLLVESMIEAAGTRSMM